MAVARMGWMATLSMLARTDRLRFGILLGRALRLKMKAKPDERDRRGGKKYLTRKEAEAELRARGTPVEVLQFCHCYHADNLPAEPPESAGPNGTRNLMEAVVNAAIRHGSDGHGKDGLVGYTPAAAHRTQDFRQVDGRGAAVAGVAVGQTE
jgi:hypothetical protein